MPGGGLRIKTNWKNVRGEVKIEFTESFTTHFK